MLIDWGLCLECGNHPMNPNPGCQRCGRQIPPAGRLTGDRADMASWIRRYFHDYSPAPWQVELMRDIVDGRRVFTLEARPAGRRFVRELIRAYTQGVDLASGPDRTVERSTFGQQPDYPVARAEADQETDHIEKPDLDPD